MGTGFLFVVLYPYRMFILHLLIALLILMLAVVWLIVVVKVRRRMRARRQQVLLLYPSPAPLVHEDAPGEHSIRRGNACSPLPPLSDFEGTHDPDFLYDYDDRRTSKRASERLVPDQRRRF
jgi:hypothetical protein